MSVVRKHTFSSLEEALLTTLACYNALRIYPTSFELFSFLLKPKLATHCAQRTVMYSDVVDVLDQLKNLEIVQEEGGFYFFSFLRKNNASFSGRRIVTDSLLDQKWRMLSRYIPLFRTLPFVQGVFVSGSLALGTVKDQSDFDFLVISKPSRLYTLRLFSVLLFDVLGIRRKPGHGVGQTKDRLCLNHYLSSSSLVMKDRLVEGMFLYTHLVPVYLVNEDLVARFFGANEWVKDYFFRVVFEERVRLSARFRVETSFSLIRNFLEFILGGKVGDALERFIYLRQKKRIPEEQNLFATPNELNLHPNLEKRHIRLRQVLSAYFKRLW